MKEKKKEKCAKREKEGEREKEAERLKSIWRNRGKRGKTKQRNWIRQTERGENKMESKENTMAEEGELILRKEERLIRDVKYREKKRIKTEDI